MTKLELYEAGYRIIAGWKVTKNIRDEKECLVLKFIHNNDGSRYVTCSYKDGDINDQFINPIRWTR